MFADSDCSLKAQVLHSVTLKMHIEGCKPCQKKKPKPQHIPALAEIKDIIKENFLEEKPSNGQAVSQSL